MREELWFRVAVVLSKFTIDVCEGFAKIVLDIHWFFGFMLSVNTDTPQIFEDGQWVQKSLDLTLFAKKIAKNQQRIDQLNLRIATIGYFLWEYESRREITSASDVFFISQLRLFVNESRNEIHQLGLANRAWHQHIDEEKKLVKWKWMKLFFFMIFIIGNQVYIWKQKDD